MGITRLTRRRYLQVTAASLACAGARADEPGQDEVVFGSGVLEAAAARFDCTPPLGFRAPTFGQNPVVRRIDGPIETRLFAIRQGNLCIGWGNSDYAIFDETRQRIAAALDIPFAHTIHSCTHNHSTIDTGAMGPNDKTGFTQRYYTDLEKCAASLRTSFAPASISWAVETEASITYNRKGRRPDGTTYLMREEDRIKLPASYTGVIDPRATLLRFDRPDGSPMLFVTHFTGHPVISYSLEEPIVNPDYSGWSMIDLLGAYPSGKAVGVFLQGCAGDINAKGMFSGPQLARESGRKLASAFIKGSRHTRRIAQPQLGFASGMAYVPYGPLPPMAQLEKEKAEILDFQRRVDAGDANTLRVLGYNFSETMKMSYRRALADPFLKWTNWAIEMQKAGKTRPLESLPVRVNVVSLGDVALVAMPHELFVGIGLSVRERSPFAYTVPAAYSNVLVPNYIGGSKDVGDREYMSSFYRYAIKPPYAKPAGDAIADKAVELLNKLYRQRPPAA